MLRPQGPGWARHFPITSPQGRMVAGHSYPQPRAPEPGPSQLAVCPRVGFHPTPTKLPTLHFPQCICFNNSWGEGVDPNIP